MVLGPVLARVCAQVATISTNHAENVITGSILTISLEYRIQLCDGIKVAGGAVAASGVVWFGFSREHVLSDSEPF